MTGDGKCGTGEDGEAAQGATGEGAAAAPPPPPPESKKHEELRREPEKHEKKKGKESNEVSAGGCTGETKMTHGSGRAWVK